MAINSQRLKTANQVVLNLGDFTYKFVEENGNLFLTWTKKFSNKKTQQYEKESFNMLCKFSDCGEYFSGDVVYLDEESDNRIIPRKYEEQAIVQLARWILGMDVKPLGWWRELDRCTSGFFWAVPRFEDLMFELLIDGGYPES